jgi:O-antigen/teichoic acid export membrane protein
VLGFAIPLLILTDLLGNIARAFGSALPYVVIRNLIPQLSTMPLLISLVLWHGPQIGVAYAQSFGLAIGFMFGIGFVWHLIRARIGRVRPILQLRRLYSYALPVSLNVAASMVMGWTDLFLLGVLTDASTVGIYRGCMQVALVFDLVSNAVLAATAPLYTVLIADGQREPLQETYTAALRVATLLAIPLLLVIIVNAGDILGLLGPRFTEGAAAVLVLACGHCVRVALGPAFVVLIIGGRQLLDTGNLALAAGLNLVLNLILIPTCGLLGAALSTAISLIGLALLRCLQLRRVLALRTLDPTLLRPILVTAPLALAIWAASVLLELGPGSGLVSLLLRLIAMAAVISGSLWLFCLDAADRAMLLRLARRRGAPPASPTGQ